MGTVERWEGETLRHEERLDQSEGQEEAGTYDCGGLLSVSVKFGDEPDEFHPDHLLLICGGVSAGLVLRNKNRQFEYGVLFNRLACFVNNSSQKMLCTFNIEHLYLIGNVPGDGRGLDNPPAGLLVKG